MGLLDQAKFDYVYKGIVNQDELKAFWDDYCNDLVLHNIVVIPIDMEEYFDYYNY